MRNAMLLFVLLAAAFIATPSAKAQSQPMQPMQWSSIDGAGWFWNTANNLHMIMEGPWYAGYSPIGGYCYKCGGWMKG